MKQCSFIILLTLLVSACVPPITTESLRPEGDVASLKLKNNPTCEIELLVISKSQLHIKTSNKIKVINTSEIKEIKIYGYDVSAGQKIGGALPALLFETIILLAASSVDQTAWMAVAGLSMVGTLALWLNAGPKQNYHSPFSESDIENLRLYCRYPQGLSDKKWTELLEFHNQENVQKLP